MAVDAVLYETSELLLMTPSSKEALFMALIDEPDAEERAAESTGPR